MIVAPCNASVASVHVPNPAKELRCVHPVVCSSGYLEVGDGVVVGAFPRVVAARGDGAKNPVTLANVRSPVGKRCRVVEIPVVFARVEHNHASNSVGFVAFCLVEVRIVLQVSLVDQ
eukprot:1251806-Heterocapsa_arctica.AAC.1